MAMEASISPLIVVGRFDGAGAPFWATPQRIAPSPGRHALIGIHIYTPITIQPTTVIRGAGAILTMAAVAGGSVGCSTETVSPALDLDVGAEYLYFGNGPILDPLRNSTGAYRVYAAWPVTEGRTVLTPEEGAQTIADVLATVAAHPILAPGAPLPFPTPKPGDIVEASPDNGP